MARGMSRSAANANSHSGEGIDPQVGDDRLEPVMATRAAFGAEAHRAERKVDVVDNNKQVVERRLVPIDCFAHRRSAEIHVGARLEEYDFFSPVKNLDQVRAKAIASFSSR